MTDAIANPLFTYQHAPSDDFGMERWIEPLDGNDSGVYVDERPAHMILEHSIKAVWDEFVYILRIIWEEIVNLFREVRNHYCDVANAELMEGLDAEASPDATDTVFIIPGLKDAGGWGHFARRKLEAAYENNERNVDVRVVRYPERGNQAFELSFTPIFKMISEYCKKNPGKPIVIMGSSLGGRLAHKIEAALRAEYDNPVMVYSMAGAFASQHATNMRDHIPCLANLVVKGGLLDDFSVGSSTTTQLVEEENTPLGDRVRVIHAVQASEDPLINDANAFPRLVKQDTLTYVRKVAYAARHIGVVGAAMDDAVAETTRFFGLGTQE